MGTAMDCAASNKRRVSCTSTRITGHWRKGFQGRGKCYEVGGANWQGEGLWPSLSAA